jgi:ketosteroid isomerase-like protein
MNGSFGVSLWPYRRVHRCGAARCSFTSTSTTRAGLLGSRTGKSKQTTYADSKGGTDVSNHFDNDAASRPELTTLRCAGCGAIWLSPAGRPLIEEQERCLRCDGLLVLEEQGEESVSTVSRAWNRWLSGDLDGFVDENDPEVEIRPGTAEVAERVQPFYRGHAGLRRYIEDCSGDWEILPNELQTFGDRVLTLGRLLKKGAKGASHAVAWVFQVKEGKIVSAHGYLNPADALRDLQSETSD